MIKILFILNSFGTGGSERVVLDICRGINRDLFEPFVASLSDGGLAREFDKIHVWNICLNKKEGVDVRLMLRLASMVREIGIDVINAHHFSPFIHAYPSSLIAHSSLIYTDHTIHEIMQIPLIWKLVGTVLLKTCYGVVGISHGCTRQLRETFHVPTHKAMTILNAIDLGRFKHRIHRENKLEELHMNTDDRVVGVVGNLREQKNHANLVRAFKIISNRLPKAKLLVIGDGPMRDQLQGLARELHIESNIMFLGVRLDTAELYQIMDIYCLSSHYEGLPLTILEAMAMNIPIVGTDVAGINDIIVSGKNGLLVKPDNPENLAEAILSLLDNPEEGFRLAKNGYHYVHTHHSMLPWIGAYEDLFTKAAHK